MIDYFYQSKKDPNDLNDEELKNIILKNHKTYISFIKAQENLLLMPMKEAMDKMINNQRDIVKYFNEQVLNANKLILKNQQEQIAKFEETNKTLIRLIDDKEKLKVAFLQILNTYIKNREELGSFKTREKEDLIANVRKLTSNL